MICTILGENDGELGLFKHGGVHRIYHELPHSYGKFDMLSGNNKVLNLYFGVSYSQRNAYYRTPEAALVGQAHPTKMAGCRPVHISVKMASSHNVSIIFKVICLKIGDFPK